MSRMWMDLDELCYLVLLVLLGFGFWLAVLALVGFVLGLVTGAR